MFLVPKYLVNEDGSLGERNGVKATNLEHKMGLKVSTTCELTFGGDPGRPPSARWSAVCTTASADAVVDAADQGATAGQPGRRRTSARRSWTALRPILCSRVGNPGAVPLAERAVLIHQVLGHQEHRQALGAGTGALRTGEHQVEDVLRHVLVAVGDEPLDALDVPGPIGLLDHLGPARPHVGPASGSVSTMVAPQPRSTAQLGEALLLGSTTSTARRERRPVGEHPGGQVRTAR